jgi:hypothetical protein
MQIACLIFVECSSEAETVKKSLVQYFKLFEGYIFHFRPVLKTSKLKEKPPALHRENQALQNSLIFSFLGGQWAI